MLDEAYVTIWGDRPICRTDLIVALREYIPRHTEYMNTIRDELMDRTWARDRYVDWCLPECEKGAMMHRRDLLQEELMERAWEPDRYFDWCLPECDKRVTIDRWRTKPEEVTTSKEQSLKII